VDRNEDDSMSEGTARSVGFSEKLIAHAVVFFLAGVSFYCSFTSIEIWPFSHYPMYSNVASASYRQMILMGITATGEVDLTHGRYFRPFHVGRIRVAYDRLRKQNENHRRRMAIRGRKLPEGYADKRLRIATLYLLYRYETLRRAGAHDGPKIRGLRLYSYEWDLESGAHNRESPKRIKLIAEYRPGGGGRL